MGDLAVLDREHLQVERREAAVGLPHVEPERRLAVGGGLQHRHVVRAARALRVDQPADVLAAGVPAGERWHLPDRVGLEQGHDRGDVLLPERRHVAVEQRASVVGEVVLDRVGGEPRVGELCVGALQGAVDRGGRRLERLGDLAGLPAQHVTQDQHCALPRGQVLEGGDEGEPDAVARGDHGGGVGAGVGVDHAVGDRLQPRDLAGLDQLVAGLPAGRAEAGRERPALLALEVGEADVGGDPVQPGADRRPALERVVGLPCAQVGLLDHVLGLVDRAGHPVAVRDELASVALGHLVELLGGLARGAPGLGHLVSWPRVPP